MTVSKYGVAYNLAESPYFYEMNFRTGGVDCLIHFRFSSVSHRRKFIDTARNRIEWLNDSMSRRFRVTVRMDELAVLQLYQQVETRGFYMEIDGKVARCPDEVRLDGLRIRFNG